MPRTKEMIRWIYCEIVARWCAWRCPARRYDGEHDWIIESSGDAACSECRIAGVAVDA